MILDHRIPSDTVIIGKWVYMNLVIFNTKVLKIEGFGFREDSSESERNQWRHS